MDEAWQPFDLSLLLTTSTIPAVSLATRNIPESHKFSGQVPVNAVTGDVATSAKTAGKFAYWDLPDQRLLIALRFLFARIPKRGRKLLPYLAQKIARTASFRTGVCN